MLRVIILAICNYNMFISEEMDWSSFFILNRLVKFTGDKSVQYSLRLCVYISLYLYVCPSVCLSVCPSVSLLAADL